MFHLLERFSFSGMFGCTVSGICSDTPPGLKYDEQPPLSARWVTTIAPPPPPPPVAQAHAPRCTFGNIYVYAEDGNSEALTTFADRWRTDWKDFVCLFKLILYR